MKGIAKAAQEATIAFFVGGDKNAIERFCKRWLKSTEPHVVEGVWESLKGVIDKPAEDTFLKGDKDTAAYLKAVVSRTGGRAARERNSVGRIDSDYRGLKRQRHSQTENYKAHDTAEIRHIEKELGLHSPTLKKELDAGLTGGDQPSSAPNVSRILEELDARSFDSTGDPTFKPDGRRGIKRLPDIEEQRYQIALEAMARVGRIADNRDDLPWVNSEAPELVELYSVEALFVKVRNLCMREIEASRDFPDLEEWTYPEAIKVMAEMGWIADVGIFAGPDEMSKAIRDYTAAYSEYEDWYSVRELFAKVLDLCMEEVDF